MEKCKVIGCNNSVMDVPQHIRDEKMRWTYGYCQIHNIQGLVEEE